jgi:hypothetical protein
VGAGASASVAMLGLCSAELGDGGDGDARHAHAAAHMVLGGVSGRHASSWDLGQAAAASAGGLSRYETAWLILQELRRAMIAPERGLLTGEVEIESSFSEAMKTGSKAAVSTARRR